MTMHEDDRSQANSSRKTSHLPDMAIQTRDLEVFRGLLESRIMTVTHINEIYFGGHLEAARKRIRRLRDAGYVSAVSQYNGMQIVYRLTQRAYDSLADHALLARHHASSWQATEKRLHVAESTLRHELEVMDVKAAFYSAARTTRRVRIAEFVTRPEKVSFSASHPATGERVTVKPDGFIRIHRAEDNGGSSEHLFFLEVDRSTESLDTLVNRTLCYLQYYRDGGLAERFLAPREAYKAFPFRILITCKSNERRDNIAHRLLTSIPPVKTFACTATIDHVRSNPFGEVWITPAHRELRQVLIPT